MHGNRIPVGTILEMDPAIMKASEQKTVIQMQRRMIRVINRNKKWWRGLFVVTNIVWFLTWITR